jgi:hypothetical protein
MKTKSRKKRKRNAKVNFKFLYHLLHLKKINRISIAGRLFLASLYFNRDLTRLQNSIVKQYEKKVKEETQTIN